TGRTGSPTQSGRCPTHAVAPESRSTWRTSPGPASGGTGTAGTPASRQPSTATTVSGRGAAWTATGPSSGRVVAKASAALRTTSVARVSSPSTTAPSRSGPSSSPVSRGWSATSGLVLPVHREPPVLLRHHSVGIAQREVGEGRPLGLTHVLRQQVLDRIEDALHVPRHRPVLQVHRLAEGHRDP